ncbi:D-inositol-3-phosphate glycosyltransferase [Paeniglutamicibacter antarcticus]|uniref:D-inositol-3-phosphate glycosyltransferase n=2 Tax=Arthrobacter terrae TaxID=2935737 RepID=A0A931CNB0_9MICC|nr:D-inositol-3-phosphate glycosyltransferase [Arthrobacter terrae]MBG0740042.1 D-inositol-3-phosphate glycosyltransferase [Arthrobacter terrae]
MHNTRRVAMLSLHTSPLEQPGSGDAGGMNVYVRQLALELAAAGVEVEIFTRRTASTEPEQTRMADGVLVRHVQAGPAGPVAKEELPRLIADLTAAITAVDATGNGFRTGYFDVLHSHYWVSGMTGLALAREWKLPLVHTMHTMARVKNQHLPDGQSAEPSRRAEGEQQIVRRADRLIANTTAEAAELERHYNGCQSRIDVVAPGVDLKVFKPAFRDRSRQQCGIGRDVFHVLFAGRLQRLKGPHVLIKAAGVLHRARPDIRLQVTVIGSHSGSDRYDLGRLVSSQGLDGIITLHPAVAAEELAQWYRSADVVAMPSSSESFGLVALEAQACGTPVVATDVGGLPRAVSDGRTGLLVPGRDPGHWAAALESLYDFPLTREDLGRAASVFAESFGWQHTAELTIASYDRALAAALRIENGSAPNRW